MCSVATCQCMSLIFAHILCVCIPHISHWVNITYVADVAHVVDLACITGVGGVRVPLIVKFIV